MIDLERMLYGPERIDVEVKAPMFFTVVREIPA